MSFIRNPRKVVSASIVLVMMMVGMALMPVMSTNASASDSKELRIAIQMDMPDFNIFNLASNSNWKTSVLQWAFEGIAMKDYDGEPFPLLAESYVLDEESLEVTIQLRQGVMFHDGSELTAEDVVFTYSALRAGTVYSSPIINTFDMDFDGIVTEDEISASVWEIDTYTVGMKLASPYSNFFTDTLTIPIIPSSVWANYLKYDGIVDVTWTDPDAVIGTGPFRYDSGIPNGYRQMVKHDDYWGASAFTPDGYALSPVNIDVIRFEVMTIDDAVSALRAGSIDLIDWSLDASKVAYLESDGNVNIHYLSDNGHFFLGFNMKKEPMNSLGFRKAVEYLIDKEKIASEYSSIPATAGSYCLSDYWGEWRSDTPVPYPYDPSLQSSVDALVSAGFVDADHDGWRDMPDGSPMEPITIICPPKDYDPVRYQAAQMIGFRLNDIGIRTMVTDDDFDIIVACFNIMDYDMIILGWTQINNPIDATFGLLSPMSSSNCFGFWPEEEPNPFYSSIGEVSTLADEQTQELAREFMQLEAMVGSALVRDDQMMYVKAAQDIIAEALPLSVLYYRMNALATSNAWSGWLPYQGELLNRFSLSSLVEGQSDRVFADAASDINIGLTAPKTFIAGETGYVYSIIIDDLGQPLPAGGMMMIVYHLASGVTETTYIYIDAPTPEIETVDSAFIVPLTFPEEGYGTITVIAGYDSESVSDSVAFTVMTPIPKALMLSVVVDDPILEMGDSTLITVTAEDEYGEPVEGATISIDSALIGVGTVDADTASTDVDGVAQFVLSAPMDCGLVNAHELSTLRFNVSMLFNESMAACSWTGGASCDVLILNDAEPDWTMARVMDVSSTALNPESNVATITIEAIDAYGNAVPDLPMTVSYSSDSVYEPVTVTATDGAGSATVDVQIKEDASTGALHVTFAPMVAGGAVQADVTLTYIDEDAPPEDTMYGGYITYDSAQFIDPLENLDVNVHVWNDSGEPANVMASLVLSATSFGTLTGCDETNWSSLYDWLGINIGTKYDDVSIATEGPLNTPFDEDNYQDWMYDTGGWLFWDWGTMTGVQITEGLLELSVYGIDVAPTDLIAGITIVPDGIGWFDGVPMCYRIDGPTTITSDYVLGRSYSAVAPTVFTYDQTLEARTSGNTTVSVWVEDKDDAPVEGADVSIYQNSVSGNADFKVLSSDSQLAGSFETDIDGYAEAIVVGEGRTSVPTRCTMLCDLNVKASYPGSLSMIAKSSIMIYAIPTTMEATPYLTPIPMGTTVILDAVVCNGTGMDMSNVTISMLAADGMDWVDTKAVNDEGVARFYVATTNLTGAIAGFLPILLWTDGPGLDSSAYRMMIPIKDDTPAITIMRPYDDQVLEDNTVQIRFEAWDFTGLMSVVATIDDDPMAIPPVIPGQQLFYFDETVPVLPGIHTFKVVATDTSGMSSEKTVTFTVEMYLPTVIVERLPGASIYSTVNWDFEPFTDGLWSLQIHNFGLKAIDIVVYEVDYQAGTVSMVMQEKVMLNGADIDPSGIVYSTPFQMLDGHTYLISVTPIGSIGAYAVMETQFVI